MDECSRSRTIHYRHCPHRLFRVLGRLGCKISHGAKTPGKSSTIISTDHAHRLHLRRKLLLRPDAVADSSLQRVRP